MRRLFQDAKCPRVGKRADVADVAEQAGGPGGADAVQVEQPGAGGLDQLGQLLGRGLDLLVDCFEVGDQLGGELPAGLADDVAGPDAGQQVTGLPGGQVLVRPARHQVGEQPVQPVHGQGAGGAELVAAVGQQPQRHRRIVHLDGAHARGAQRDHGDRVGRRWRRSAALPGGGTPAPARTASPARPPHAHRRRPAAAPHTGPPRSSPPPPTPGPATTGRPRAGHGSRRCRCRTGPSPAPVPARPGPRSSPTACADRPRSPHPPRGTSLHQQNRLGDGEEGSATSSRADPS